MKKVIGILFFVTLLGTTGAWFGTNAISPWLSDVKEETPSPSKSELQEEAVKREATPGVPQRIVIPKIAVDAAVGSVGLDKNRNMDVPKKVENVAWYNLGFRPGQSGNAVIAGHFDGPDGSPAVFYRITSLTPGDKISVTDDKGQTYTYIVTEKQIYSFDKLPLQEIFGEFPKARLNLITCDGTFDRGTKNYSHRAVIFAELSEG